MDRSSLCRVEFQRFPSLSENEIVVACSQENHSRRLLDDFHAEQPLVKFSASIEISDRQTEVKHTMSFQHRESPVAAESRGEIRLLTEA
jgi:hypothetical protein